MLDLLFFVVNHIQSGQDLPGKGPVVRRSIAVPAVRYDIRLSAHGLCHPDGTADDRGKDRFPVLFPHRFQYLRMQCSPSVILCHQHAEQVQSPVDLPLYYSNRIQDGNQTI